MSHAPYTAACARELSAIVRFLEDFEAALYHSPQSREALQSLDAALIQQFDLSLQTISLVCTVLEQLAHPGDSALPDRMESFLAQAPLASVADRLRNPTMSS